MIQTLLEKSVALVPWQWRGAIKRVPVVSTAQRWLVGRLLEGREFIHTVDAGPARGLICQIKLPDDKGIWTGTYEMELAAAIAGSVRPGDVCFDCGGWHGYFAGVMALAGASRVIVFEPLPANVTRIRKMMELNPNLPITLVEAAVAERTGTIEFVVMPETSMGKLTTSPFQQENQTGEKIPVRAVALDELLASGEVQPPATMKIDVEGAELLLLLGARKLIATHRPNLFMEIHSPELARDCRSLLEQLDYKIEVIQEDEREVCYFYAVSKETSDSSFRR